METSSNEALTFKPAISTFPVAAQLAPGGSWIRKPWRPPAGRGILWRVTPSYAFQAELWLYQGEAGWHFLTLPAEVADQIAEISPAARKAFGSVKVTAEVKGHVWQTSLFPDSKSASYLLPVKKAVRDKAHLS